VKGDHDYVCFIKRGCTSQCHSPLRPQVKNKQTICITSCGLFLACRGEKWD
jgi:hypothetical protein